MNGNFSSGKENCDQAELPAFKPSIFTSEDDSSIDSYGTGSFKKIGSDEARESRAGYSNQCVESEHRDRIGRTHKALF